MTSETAPNPHRIPIRNIWLLLLYASALFRDIDSRRRAMLEENPDDIPDLIAEILAYEVDRRLARNLSAGWQPRQADLTRVRGRIDLRRTETRRLLQRGRVACKFNEITINTPRNRLVRAALARLAAITGRQDAAGQATNVAARCRALAARLERLGVGPEKPPPTEVSIDTFGRLDANDKVMVGAARLAFDLALPNETANPASLSIPRREVDWQLYEMAIYGFYKVTLSPHGWRVSHGKTLHWHPQNPTPGIQSILPSMKTDIWLEHPGQRRRIIIDTKFSDIITRGRGGNPSLQSEHIYQIYAYLRSQENPGDPLSLTASGLLLHPAVNRTLDESADIQGHPIRFAALDLAAPAPQIRRQLLAMTEPHPG